MIANLIQFIVGAFMCLLCIFSYLQGKMPGISAAMWGVLSAVLGGYGMWHLLPRIFQ